MEGGFDDQIIEDLEAQHIEWIEQENVNKTPTYFINGYELPENYDIEDLMALTPGLVESLKRKENSSPVIL
ncbi:MAG: hypothetical protein WD038_09105 [Balneolales bacterium]